MKIKYQELEKKINIVFKNKNLLYQSLTHKSFNSSKNNEKIEFLGDRVLGLVMAKKLLEIYPNEKEGILDKKFASLVNKKSCLEIAKSIEEKALNDEYFIEKKLYPNVDFYSGIIYRALGIPTEMFTVMFALGRIPGWIAQWKEMRDSKNPIGRPRQIYNGPTHRSIS